MEALTNLFASQINLSAEGKAGEKVLETVDVKGICKAIAQKKLRNIIVMVGAGIAVSAGIPDFRSPKTGLYANLQKYNLPRPEAIFDISFFKEQPQAFCTLAKELYPGEYCPTFAHSFIRLLQDKGVLLRCYTQNIDGLEFLAGVDEDKVVQAHGGFSSAHCLDCKREVDTEYIKTTVFNDAVPLCPECDGLTKPDIVFFGENLPDRFHQLSATDFKNADCLIVMGTSLQVQPFAGLIERVPQTAPRLLINLEKVGESGDEVRQIKTLLQEAKDEKEKNQYRFQLQMMAMMGMTSRGFDFDSDDNETDVFMQCTCDQGVQDVAGWIDGDYLKELQSLQRKLEESMSTRSSANASSPSSAASASASVSTSSAASTASTSAAAASTASSTSTTSSTTSTTSTTSTSSTTSTTSTSSTSSTTSTSTTASTTAATSHANSNSKTQNIKKKGKSNANSLDKNNKKNRKSNANSPGKNIKKKGKSNANSPGKKKAKEPEKKNKKKKKSPNTSPADK
jgi:NAD+-dependent protein deacetylase sirtuin 2